jgi:hypothetical protein
MDFLTHSAIGGLVVMAVPHVIGAPVSTQLVCWGIGAVLGCSIDVGPWIYKKITGKDVKVWWHTSPVACLIGAVLPPIGMHQLSDMFFHSYGEDWFQTSPVTRIPYLAFIALAIAGHLWLFNLIR